MFFSSIKEINSLMECYKYLLKSYYWEKLTFSNFAFLKFEKIVSMSVFGELQLRQILLNFKTSCCNLKIKEQNYV